MKYFLSFLLFSFSLEDCHNNCEQCKEYSDNDDNMKCKTYKDGFYRIYQTSNWVNKSEYPDHFIYEDTLFPCILFNTRCYECDFF